MKTRRLSQTQRRVVCRAQRFMPMMSHPRFLETEDTLSDCRIPVKEGVQGFERLMSHEKLQDFKKCSEEFIFSTRDFLTSFPAEGQYVLLSKLQFVESNDRNMSVSPEAVTAANRLLTTDWDTFHLYFKPESQTALPEGQPHLPPEDVKALEALFATREDALRAGIVLLGDKFSVHQWETTQGVDLVYGRRGDAVSGVGACVCRARFGGGTVIHGAITYSFPSVSANAVSKLITFVKSIGAVQETGSQTPAENAITNMVTSNAGTADVIVNPSNANDVGAEAATAETKTGDQVAVDA